MACNCIKEYMYNVQFKDCKTLIYEDKSVWVEQPTTYQISITTPVSTIPKVFDIITNQPNVLYAKDIIGIDQNLPIGIYCISVVNCNGDIFTYDFINLCSLECEIANELAYLDMNDKEAIKAISDKKLWLDILYAKFNCDWCDKEDIKKLLMFLKNGKDCKC